MKTKLTIAIAFALSASAAMAAGELPDVGKAAPFSTSPKSKACAQAAKDMLEKLKPAAEKVSGKDLSAVFVNDEGILRTLDKGPFAFIDHDKITVTDLWCFQPSPLKRFILSHEIGHAIGGAASEQAMDLTTTTAPVNQEELDASQWATRITEAATGENYSSDELFAMRVDNHLQSEHIERKLAETAASK